MAHIIPDIVVQSASESDSDTESDHSSDNLNNVQCQTSDFSDSDSSENSDNDNSNENSDNDITVVNNPSTDSSSDNTPTNTPKTVTWDTPRTRSGREYSGLSRPSPPAQATTSTTGLAGAMARARQIAGDLLDSHPLSKPPAQKRKK